MSWFQSLSKNRTNLAKGSRPVFFNRAGRLEVWFRSHAIRFGQSVGKRSSGQWSGRPYSFYQPCHRR